MQQDKLYQNSRGIRQNLNVDGSEERLHEFLATEMKRQRYSSSLGLEGVAISPGDGQILHMVSGTMLHAKCPSLYSVLILNSLLCRQVQVLLEFHNYQPGWLSVLLYSDFFLLYKSINSSFCQDMNNSFAKSYISGKECNLFILCPLVQHKYMTTVYWKHTNFF